MAWAPPAIDSAIAEVERLRRVLKKSRMVQVRSSDERALAKATASAWFSNHRGALETILPGSAFDAIDAGYKNLLEASDRHGARSKYVSTLGALKQHLIRLRTECLAAKPLPTSTSDQPPDFSPLIADAAMQKILITRWDECLLCLNAKASLAATVMMGGLLEAILLARVNRESNKAPLFTAKAAPKSPKTGTVKPLGEWMLNDFIQVLSELKWITVSATAVGAVLRDYRNYIHPQKQLSHSMHLKPEDAGLFWEVTKNIVRQVIAGAP